MDDLPSPYEATEIEKLRAERDRYRILAGTELRTEAARKIFAAASAAALQAVRDLPEDERTAFEASMGKPMEVALKEGVQFTLNGQRLDVKG